jgi:ATP-dependent DNA helicase RecG
MTTETLRSLIAAGETMTIEFKGEERKPLNDRELVEAVVCLANRSGDAPAWLLVGVEDNGRITGARPRHGRVTEPHKVCALISARTRPALTVKVEIMYVDQKPVLVIQIPPQHQPVGSSEGVYLRRIIGGDARPACIPMDVYAMQSLQSDRGLLDPSAQIIAAARWEDLDPLEFERFRRSVRERHGRSDESLLDLPDLELAKALGVVEANGAVRGVRLAALLLFGKEGALRRFVPNHEVAFQALSGLEVEVNDFFRWPLLRVTEEIEARIRIRNREKELMVGVLRVGVPDYSERALREALANALIHRDYQRLGAVHFQCHPDRIEISNPGGFPDGVRLDNLLVTKPRPRNPMLADAFKRAGIVERTARGIDTIFYEQLRNGRAAPSYARTDDTGVVVVIPCGTANLEFVRVLVEEGRSGRVWVVDELLALNALWQKHSMRTEDVSRLTQKPESEASAILYRLLEAGLVKERGQPSSRTWQLSAVVDRAAGHKGVRQRGFEPFRREQMMPRYVERRGKVARKKPAELRRMNPIQATRLLDRLLREGARGTPR